MADVQRLFSDFIAADRSGGDPEPLGYLERVKGTDRAELEALIDAYLARAPRRAFDEAAFAASPTRTLRDELMHSLTGLAGAWPTLLPQLRHRAELKRSEVVERLAAELDAHGQEQKVGSYYHAMEQGLLAPAGVSDRVLKALSAILGESAEALRRAGRALTGGPFAGGPEAVFARVAQPDDQFAAEELAQGSPTMSEAGERDFIDELFTGGSDSGS